MIKGRAFISGPYRGDLTDACIAANLAKARVVAQEVTRLGWVPVCPNLMFTEFAELQNWNFWLEASLKELDTCDILVLVPGWRNSTGVSGEIVRAVERHMPVFKSSEDLAIYEADLLGMAIL
ncbi:DUF1937 family protein [Candidatus Pacearchaeota archaeon]|jgi:hypothetical protein|nr:DUF1937 family protein [Candidatus Pacearchaeota archaeon]